MSRHGNSPARSSSWMLSAETVAAHASTSSPASARALTDMLPGGLDLHRQICLLFAGRPTVVLLACSKGQQALFGSGPCDSQNTPPLLPLLLCSMHQNLTKLLHCKDGHSGSNMCHLDLSIGGTICTV